MRIPLTVPEVRRSVLALRESETRQSFRLEWSRWRRAHQAVAARCHAVRRVRRMQRNVAAHPPAHSPAPPRSTAAARRETTEAPVSPAQVHRPLTDAEWQRILPLLPPRRPPIGRPCHDHRTVLTGILAVICSGASWREMPREYGKWETAYKRYRLWQDDGRLQHILEAGRGPIVHMPA
jgi:hypothetical protein